MSSDLLRRAATKLREHANAAPEGPWVSLDDGDRLVALRPDSSFDKGFRYLVDEPIPDSSIAEYFALMHPPVALALAELLDLEVKHWDASRLGEQAAGAEPGILTGAREEAVHALARAILREPEVKA